VAAAGPSPVTARKDPEIGPWRGIRPAEGDVDVGGSKFNEWRPTRQNLGASEDQAMRQHPAA